MKFMRRLLALSMAVAAIHLASASSAKACPALRQFTQAEQDTVPNVFTGKLVKHEMIAFRKLKPRLIDGEWREFQPYPRAARLTFLVSDVLRGNVPPIVEVTYVGETNHGPSMFEREWDESRYVWRVGYRTGVVPNFRDGVGPLSPDTRIVVADTCTAPFLYVTNSRAVYCEDALNDPETDERRKAWLRRRLCEKPY